MAQITGQAIGDIDRGTGQTQQIPARSDPRPWSFQALPQVCPMPLGDFDVPPNHGQPQTGITQGSGHANQIPRSCPGACQRCGRRDETVHLYRNRQWPARRVATDQLNLVLPSQIEQPPAETRKPVLVRLRQRQPQGHPSRCRTHRRQIAEIDRQGFMADSDRIGIAEKMSSGDQYIHADDQVSIGRHLEHRTIIAYSQYDITALHRPMRKKTFDQREF